MRLRWIALSVGLAVGILLFVASVAKMPAHPEGPPLALPWYLFYASFAVIVLTLVVVVPRRMRPGVIIGTTIALALGGLGMHAYVDPPHNLVECARDGYPPHQLFCSYHNRNTPLAHRQAGYLASAGIVVALLTSAGFIRADNRRRHVESLARPDVSQAG